MKNQSQFDLATVLGTIRRRIKLVLAVAIAAAALATGLSLLQDDRYEASADLQFSQEESAPSVDPAEPPADPTESPERIAATNLALASLDTVGVRARERLNSPLSIEGFRDTVKLEPQGQADIVRVTAEAGSARGAARVANAYADEVVAVGREKSQEEVQRVIDAIDAQLAGVDEGSPAAESLENRKRQLEVEKTVRTGDVQVVQEALPPPSPSSPKPVRNGVIGGFLGLILGIVLALVLQRLDRRVDDEEELGEIVGAPVIARVPVERDSVWERELFIESFQFLRANLQLQDPDSEIRTIAITSALPGNGKSTVAGCLADAFALSGSEVIVVDCDLRRPTLHEYFKVEAHQGLTTALVGLRDPVELLQQTDTPGVRLLPAGPLMPIPASVLAGNKGMGKILDRLRGAADYVIVDTSPVTIGADASTIASAVDATVMVVDIATVPRDVLAAAVQQLRSARANIVGMVINRAELMLQDSAYRGYYGASGRALFAEESGLRETEAFPQPLRPEPEPESRENGDVAEPPARASGRQAGPQS